MERLDTPWKKTCRIHLQGVQMLLEYRGESDRHISYTLVSSAGAFPFLE
jgi:hypothetical protein